MIASMLFLVLAAGVIASCGREPAFEMKSLYSQESGDSWHNVGQDNYVNTYRGAYWVGPSLWLGRAVFHLNRFGNPDGISYRASVWEADASDHLRLKTLLGQSSVASGSLVSDGGSWVPFDFSDPVLVTSGRTVILVSRADSENADRENFIRINNNYDTDDEDNYQFNVHYAGRTLAGRRPGDEDQPEPFAVNIRLLGSWAEGAIAGERPAPPMRLLRNDVSAAEVDLSWADRNAAVKVSSYRIYEYDPATAALSWIGDSPAAATSLTGLGGASARLFVVTAIGDNGAESYYSDVAKYVDPVR